MTYKIKLNAIAAICNENNGIGVKNTLPWSISEDHFYYLRVINTLQNN
jgi:dihydrofolate reductase